METKVFRYLLVTLIVILINLSTVAAVPSHKNVDEMSYDPEDLILYFQRCVDDGTDAFAMLAAEDFQGFQAPISSLESRLAPVRAVASYYSFPNSHLYEYYVPASGLADFYDSVGTELLDINEGLLTISLAADPSAYEGLMAQLRERIDLLYIDTVALLAQFQSLTSLGIDTAEIMGAYNSFIALLDTYDRELFEFERLYSSEYTFFTIRASPLDESGIIEVSGLLYITGAPVANNAAVLYANGAVVQSGTTDENGHITFSYLVPLPLSSSSVSFFAQSAVGGVVYTSNTVTVPIDIPTSLSLDKSYSIEGDEVSLNLYGYLAGMVGGALTDRPVVVSVNGESLMAVTGPGGAYSLSLSLPFGESLGVTAYAEFFPDSGEPYQYARSPTLQFTVLRPHEIIDKDVPSVFSNVMQVVRKYLLYILVAIGLAVSVAYIATSIKRRMKRRGAHGSDSPIEPLQNIPTGERDLFDSEVSLLRQVGNTKEAIVVGYGALIGMLDRVGILPLQRDTTHLDIDSTLSSLPYTKPEAPLITKAFELSRYSPFSIGRRTYDAFIGALHSVSERIGDKR